MPKSKCCVIQKACLFVSFLEMLPQFVETNKPIALCSCSNNNLAQDREGFCMNRFVLVVHLTGVEERSGF